VKAEVAVFAIGNRSRGDDAVAPLLLERLGAWLDAEGLAGRFELFEEYQLQVENALDLEGRTLALFIDAQSPAMQAVALTRVHGGGPSAAHSTHALSPQAVLAVYRQVTGREPPPAFSLGVRASGFDLGLAPTDDALAAMDAAWETLRELCRSPGEAQWSRMASVACPTRA
jgi:hydrogenase maturation protease